MDRRRRRGDRKPKSSQIMAAIGLVETEFEIDALGRFERLFQLENGFVLHAFVRIDAPSGLRLAVDGRRDRPSAVARLAEGCFGAANADRFRSRGAISRSRCKAEFAEHEVAVFRASRAAIRQMFVGQGFESNRRDAIEIRRGLDAVSVGRWIFAAGENGMIVQARQLRPPCDCISAGSSTFHSTAFSRGRLQFA